MTIAAYNTISNKTIYSRLVAELTDTFPDPNKRLEFTLLEKLPYLVCLLYARCRSLSNMCRLQLSRKHSGILIPSSMTFHADLDVA